MNEYMQPNTGAGLALPTQGGQSPMTPMTPLMNAGEPTQEPSLDLPATLQGLFGGTSPQVGVTMEAQPALGGMGGETNPNAAVLDIYSQPGYAMGGMVGVDPGVVGVDPSMPPAMTSGAPAMPSGAPTGVGIAPQDNSPLGVADVETFANQHPEQIQQIAMQLQQMVQSGEVTMEQVSMAEQLATVVLQNPSMYPQMRQFAIQQGLIEEQDISVEYDQGLVFAVMLAAKALKGMPQGQMGMPQGQMGMEEMQNFADGGYVTPGSNAKKGGYAVGPGTGTSDSIPIRVSAGEYVVPAHIVRDKGKEFFDGMLDKYRKDRA
jgi:hypothetical protein